MMLSVRRSMQQNIARSVRTLNYLSTCSEHLDSSRQYHTRSSWQNDHVVMKSNNSLAQQNKKEIYLHCRRSPYVQLRVLSEKSTTQSPSQEAIDFLLSLGYSEAVSNGIINALLQNGIAPSSLFPMIKGLAGRYEVGEDGGLEALAASVKTELEKKEGKSTVKIWCLPSTGWSPSDDNEAEGLPTVHSMERAFVVEALEGVTLTDIVNHGTGENNDVLGEYLECACSGIMACSTCHVVIHPDWYDATAVENGKENDRKKIGPPSEAELDMIDLAHEPQLTSRLGCQIKVTKDLDGLVVLLPSGSNNLMDFVPFE